MPPDLQSGPFGRFGTPPRQAEHSNQIGLFVQPISALGRCILLPERALGDHDATWIPKVLLPGVR